MTNQTQSLYRSWKRRLQNQKWSTSVGSNSN